MKSRLTFDQHTELGQRLAAMRDELLAHGVMLANAYPKRAPSSRSLRRALAHLDQARSDLDDAVFREHPNAASPETYYPDR